MRFLFARRLIVRLQKVAVNIPLNAFCLKLFSASGDAHVGRTAGAHRPIDPTVGSGGEDGLP
jgi:hypothetical protein